MGRSGEEKKSRLQKSWRETVTEKIYSRKKLGRGRGGNRKRGKEKEHEKAEGK